MTPFLPHSVMRYMLSSLLLYEAFVISVYTMMIDWVRGSIVRSIGISWIYLYNLIMEWPLYCSHTDIGKHFSHLSCNNFITYFSRSIHLYE